MRVKHTLLFMAFCLLLSSCGAIREARIRENNKEAIARSKPPVPKKKRTKSKKQTPVTEKEEREPVKNTSLNAFIDKWMGVPYCYGGMTMKCTDCSGFVCNLYKEVYHIELPHTSEKQYEMASKVRTAKLKEGDLVFFDTGKSSSSISHVGVYLGNNKFVHASTSKGVRIDNLEDDYFKKTFRGGGNVN